MERGMGVASDRERNLFPWRNNMLLTRSSYARESGAGLSHLSDRIQRALNETLGGLDWQYRDSAAASWVPAVDVFEEADAIRIAAEIPGVKPEDIKISLEGNLLTIHGTKQQEAEIGRASCRERG